MKKHFVKTMAMLLAVIVTLSVTLTGCASKPSENTAAGTWYETESSDAGVAYAPEESYYYEEEIDFNAEEYTEFDENGFTSTLTTPLSTFAADVDTASYSNIRRVINKGSMPQPDMVRVEEMLNYFHYDYPQPQGEDPFSVTMEMSDCPWNADTKLLLIGLQAEKIETESLPSSNFVFLIDVSGSMYSDDKLPLVQRSFSLLVDELDEDDRVSIVTYASSDRVVLEGVSGDQKPEILEAINGLEAGGGTAGSKGIMTAYDIAEANFIKGGNNRIILATDGDLNIGASSEGELKRLVEKERDRGINLSVLGFGTGNIKDNKMEALADNGNGNYSYIDTLAEARRVLISEMGGTLFTVAKDVKLQMDFNPAQIKGYRLIGYEDRLMAAEDFADDTKDGGEIGAGHRVTVLYEIVDKDSPFAVASASSVYTQASDNGSSDLFTLNIRYKQPDGDTSKLLTYPADNSIYSPEMSQNMILASAVAETGMLLRRSEFAGTSSYADVKELLKQHDMVIEDESILDFYDLVNKLDKLSGGADEQLDEDVDFYEDAE